MNSYGKWDRGILRQHLHPLHPFDYQSIWPGLYLPGRCEGYMLENMTSLRGKTQTSRSGIKPKQSSHRMATEELNMQTELPHS